MERTQLFKLLLENLERGERLRFFEEFYELREMNPVLFLLRWEFALQVEALSLEFCKYTRPGFRGTLFINGEWRFISKRKEKKAYLYFRLSSINQSIGKS